jgi:hypothetical protein
MNKIIRTKDCYLLIIKRRNGEVYKVKISLCDLYKVQSIRWFVSKSSRQIYIKSSLKYKRILLHNYILPRRRGLFCDHINGDTLDNRRENLRHVTRSQNCWNAKIRKDNTSSVKGVIWYKNTKKWSARITYKNKRISLGHFSKLSQAINARLKAEVEFYKEYARKKV